MTGVLKKWPSTENEYWDAVEAVGGIKWWHEHEVNHQRLPNTQEIQDFIADCQTTLERLASEVVEKFGVISVEDTPHDWHNQAAPDGKKWWWEWYEEQKELAADR